MHIEKNDNIISLISNNNNDCNYYDIKNIINKSNINDYYLYASTFNNNPKTIKLLLNKGCNIHYDNDKTFISSVMNNQIEVVKILLEHGANVNANYGEAIKFCTLVNNINMIKLLLSYDADYLVILKYYVSNNNIEIIKLLCECNVDFNKYNILLNICCISKNDDNFDIVKLLLNNGVKLNIHNTNPISWCIKNNNIKIIKLFIENQVIINSDCIKICSEINNNDSHFEIIKLFYDQGANFNYVKFNSNNVNTIKYINQISININFRNLDICPITFESLENEEKLGCINCLNVFKKDAINQWLNYNNICPLCKKCSRFINA